MTFGFYDVAVHPFHHPSLLIVSTALCSCALPAAQAAEKDAINSQGYQQLVTLLSEQIALLQTVTDSSTAAAVVSPLMDNKAKQKALSGLLSDEQSFSLYILRTDARKTEINHLLLEVTAETQRITKAGSFGQNELQALLVPTN